MKTKAPKKESEVYEIVAIVMGKTYKSSGEDLKKAFYSLNIGSAKDTKIILKVKHGKNERERVLMWRAVSRFFNSAGTTKEIAFKNINILFSDL